MQGLIGGKVDAKQHDRVWSLGQTASICLTRCHCSRWHVTALLDTTNYLLINKEFKKQNCLNSKCLYFQ